MPVSSYAPELMELYKVAAQREVVLEFDTQDEAATFRFRCHNLRREMREETHELVRIANSVQFRLRPTQSGKYAILCGPADTTFVDKLHAAGVVVELPKDVQLSKDEPPHPEELESMTEDELTESEAALQRFLKTGRPG